MLALQEWRHWLEEVAGKVRVNPHLQLGSKNAKPDALSHQFSADTALQDPELILPPACVVGMVTWQVEERSPGIRQLTPMFVPKSLSGLTRPG